MSPGANYQVRIQYREPSYERYAGPKAAPYSWTYQVSAPTPQAARALALEEFAEMARSSSVGWARQVVSIELVEYAA